MDEEPIGVPFSFDGRGCGTRLVREAVATLARGRAAWRCLAPSAASSSRKVRPWSGHLDAAHDYPGVTSDFAARPPSAVDAEPRFLPLWFVLPIIVGLVMLVYLSYERPIPGLWSMPPR